MAVLIDPPRWPAHGRLWSHLATDTALPELHALAARAGIPRRAFEGDHYDVPAERYDDLVRAGAVPVEGRELLRRLVASGLRVPKRRGEHVLSSAAVHDHLPDAGPGRLDVVRSSLPLAPDAVHEHLLLDRDADGEVLLVRGPGRDLDAAAAVGRRRTHASARVRAAPARRRARARRTGTRGRGPRARCTSGPPGPGCSAACACRPTTPPGSSATTRWCSSWVRTAACTDPDGAGLRGRPAERAAGSRRWPRPPPRGAT